MTVAETVTDYLTLDFGPPVLVRPSDAVLRKQLEPFDFQNPAVDPIQFAKYLAGAMIELGGIGLAANQLGYEHRVFAVRSNPILVCYNPVIVDTSAVQEVLLEACLSFPGIKLRVKRPRTIKIRYSQPNGEVINATFTGMTARIMQHELSHLNGEIFAASITRLQKEVAMAQANKNGHHYVISDLL